MPVLPHLPRGCILRPALPQDRWKIHQLLAQFERETHSSFFSTHPLLQYGVIGLGLAILFDLTLILGIATILAIVGTIAVLWAMVHLSLISSEDWTKFWVIERNGKLLACAKLSQGQKYSTLYNVLVAPEWRGKGLGSYLVDYLAHIATKPLYLACDPDKISFYARFGFVTISPQQLHPLIHSDLGLSTRLDIVPLVLMPYS